VIGRYAWIVGCYPLTAHTVVGGSLFHRFMRPSACRRKNIRLTQIAKEAP
jgi:hypothetical protein